MSELRCDCAVFSRLEETGFIACKDLLIISSIDIDKTYNRIIENFIPRHLLPIPQAQDLRHFVSSEGIL